MGSKAWQTPPAYFRQRWELHHFTVDAAASEANALVRPCDRHPCAKPGWASACNVGDFHIWTRPDEWVPAGRYYTEETDGLKAEHYQAGDRVWCNPPYDASILRWVKLARELSRDLGVLWDMLLPPSIETRWFHLLWNDQAGHWRDGIEGHFLPYRLAFIDPEHPEKVSPRAGNLQVTFWPEVKA